MNLVKFTLIILAIAILTVLQACIHEYPIGNTGTGNGENPTAVQSYIELNYDLNWEKLIHTVDFSTKSGFENTHRFIVEVTRDGQPVVHDVEYIDDDEFATGQLRRKLSIPLSPDKYEISAWYDRVALSGDSYFNADDLTQIRIINTSTTDTLAFHCASSFDILDLREYAEERNTSNILKELEMCIPGARIQIVATDVQDFIMAQKEALNQGDKFTTHLEFISNGFNSFNAFSEEVSKIGEEYLLSGWMRLPFEEYEELTIAQGFVFCKEEDIVSMRLSVYNSSHSIASKTEIFSFPVKRGYITVIKGDFLTHPVDGFFSIDNIWEGEIFYEI